MVSFQKIMIGYGFFVSNAFIMIFLTLTFYFYYSLARATKINKRHVPNSAYPVYTEIPKYDIKLWANQLHLQVCTFVEIGMFMCALFVEIRHPNFEEANIEEYFLGICDMNTLEQWKLCSPELERERPRDCRIFHMEKPATSRVHRRLCDVTNLAHFAKQCNCSATIWNVKLLKVTGFPTCFVPPTPTTLCTFNVCGWTLCNASTVLGRIHTVKCNPHCVGNQPFCEYPVELTAQVPHIYSFWTDWHEIDGCDDDDEFCTEQEANLFTEEATCINKFTGEPAIDCLGPGTSCCPLNAKYCKCGVILDQGGLKVLRMFKPTSSPIQKRSARRYKRQISVNLSSEEHFIEKLQQILHPRDKSSAFNKVALNDDDDDEYDDDTFDNSEEDIRIEEDQEEPLTTTESLEKEEMKEHQKGELMKNDNSTENVIMGGNTTETVYNKSPKYSCHIFLEICLYYSSFNYIL